MKLYYSPNSPYARKCRVVALEKGLGDRVEFIKTDPWENAAELVAVTPLGTVPALLIDDGTALCDSTVICEYLDSLSPQNPLFPVDSKQRFHALGLAALADGMIDAAVSSVIETMRRPEEKRWAEWVIRKENAIKRGMAVIEEQLAADETLHIGSLNLAVALAYASFRLPQLGWRRSHPGLSDWYDVIAERPSMIATAPAA